MPGAISVQPSPALAHTTCTALSIGELAKAQLAASRLQVMAVFTRSFYLSTDPSDNGLICCCHANLEPGPLNILCEPWHEPAVPGTVFQNCNNGFTANAAFFYLGSADTWTPPPPPALNLHRLQEGLCSCATLLAFSPCFPTHGLGSLLGAIAPLRPDHGMNAIHSFSLPPEALRLPDETAHSAETLFPLWALALPALHQMQSWLSGADISLEQAVSSLLGLGPGLTPSGDDVLGGILVGLHALERYSRCRQLYAVIRGHESHTTRIARAHLKATSCGMAAEAVHLWLNALMSAAPVADMQPVALRLHALGASSGWDAALGVWMVLQSVVQTQPV